MNDAILAVLILLPLALTFILKSNAALGLLALLAGYSVETLAGTDISTAFDKLKLNLSNVDTALILIAAPLILTLILTARSWSGKSKLPLHLGASVLAGLILIILAAPFLDSALDKNLYDSNIWRAVQHAEAPIISVGALYGLIIIWLSGQKSSHKKHK